VKRIEPRDIILFTTEILQVISQKVDSTVIFEPIHTIKKNPTSEVSGSPQITNTQRFFWQISNKTKI
ncbi:hypothetical protein PJP10_31925, partial [Mycobacterium kansasii]